MKNFSIILAIITASISCNAQINYGDFENYPLKCVYPTGAPFDNNCLGPNWKDFSNLDADVLLENNNYFASLFSFNPGYSSASCQNSGIYNNKMVFQAGMEYTLVFRYKTDPVYNSNASLKIGLSNVIGTSSTFSLYLISTKFPITNTNWVWETLKFVPNANYAQLAFYNESCGSGARVDIDDIQITNVKNVINNQVSYFGGCCDGPIVYSNTNNLPVFTKASTITAVNNVLVDVNQDITFQGGEYVDLLDGFSTSDNLKQFEAYIVPCTTEVPDVKLGPDILVTSSCTPIGIPTISGYSYNWTAQVSNNLGYLSSTSISNPQACFPNIYFNNVKYTLKVDNGCGVNSDDLILYGNNATRVEQQEIINIVFPNPISSGELNFGRMVTNYSLLNSRGAQVRKGGIVEKMDVSGLNAGFYLLKLDDQVEKIIVE